MSPNLRIALFFLFVAMILVALARHLCRRLVQAFHPPPVVRRLMAFALYTGIALNFASRFVSHSPVFAKSLGTIGGAVTLGILIASVLLLPYDIALAANSLARRIKRGKRPERARDATPNEPRRSFLKQAAVGSAASIGMGASIYGALVGRHDFALETVPVRLARLPRTLDGLSILQLSDLHVGLYVGEYEFTRALEIVGRAKPDIIVLTGDLVDHDVRYAPTLGRFARALRERAPRGLFAVPGNHDYYAGVAPVVSALREAGAEVLTNRHVILGDRGGRLVLAGLDDVMAPDFGGRGPNVARTFQGAPADLPRVLLSHNPSYFPTSHASADLTLSGHTHGGQITLFINPAELVLRHGYVRGLYRHGESQLYVNRGFGTAGPPARVGSAPEITKLVLTTS